MIIEYDPEAVLELQNTVSYYNSEKTALGTEFQSTFEAAIKMIAETPQRWPKVRGPYRRYLLDRFPFWIIYSNDDMMLTVMAIAHTSRKPGYWIARLKH